MSTLFRNRYVLFLALLVSFAVFGPSLYYNSFIFDDGQLIFENLKVVNASWSGMLNHWAISNTPIIYNIWQMVSMLFGTNEAFPFRLLNILFHSFNGLLVFMWCKAMISAFLREYPSDLPEDKNSLIVNSSFLGFIVYILHPAHVESVVWISSLKEVLSATFGILSFLCFFKNNEKPHVRYEVLTVAFYLCGILTHPTVAALPLVYVWLDLSLFKRTGKEVFFKNGIYVLLLIAAVNIHKTVNTQTFGAEERPMYTRLVVSFNALFSYLEKVFFPLFYSFDYMMTPSHVTTETQTMIWPKLKAFAAGIFIWILILSHKRVKYSFLHFSFFMIILLASVNLGMVGYAFQNISTVADRFLYFPLIGLSLLFAFIYMIVIKTRDAKKILISKILMGCYLVVFLCLSVSRVYDWRSSSSLLSASISNGYMSYPLTLSLGASLVAEKKYDEALKKFDEAYELTQKVDQAGKKIIAVSGSEAMAHKFRVYKIIGDEKEGLDLFWKVVSAKVEITPELAWAISEYFISLKRWYDADDLAKYASALYPESKTLLILKAKIKEIKLKSVLEAYISLGLNDLDNENYAAAQLNFNHAHEIKKNLKIEHRSLDQYLKMTNKTKTDADRKR